MKNLSGKELETTSLKTIEELLAATPRCNSWEGCAGESLDQWEVTAILENGDEVVLAEKWESAHASNNDPTTSGGALTIGEQITGILTGRILRTVALRLHLIQYVTYRGNEEDVDITEVIPFVEPDWGKIRRRIEDALRKTTNNAILYRIALELGVKIY
jgi:hypothetical protein